ncbi:uncharacterized protein LOC130632632 [Hydractinia symbiolongicarpus]|uniref:uncharacterized protein LOC130632632 n=1 Tax=Hydractinia symbiolongicarpus TaxID=13093 RepID=UPI002551591D|nr:uncharacterized protein LOC130632632 [Hydractinia symbiolongicarpus]
MAAAAGSFEKVKTFLESRGIEYLLNSFILNKIDDNVAPQVEQQKLVELGLAYGDILSYRLIFALPVVEEKSYHEKADELRKILKRAHSGKGHSLEQDFIDIETYGLSCRDKKKGIQVYLYYPKSFAKLEFSKLCNKSYSSMFELDTEIIGPEETVISSAWAEGTSTITVPPSLPGSNFVDRSICSVCSCTYIGSCLRCEQNESYTATLLADQTDNMTEDTFLASPDPDAVTNTAKTDIDVNIENSTLRDLRLRHFSRNTQKPVRYRHSIGSPSLSLQLESTEDSSAFGDDEVNRFMENYETDNFDNATPQFEETETDSIAFMQNCESYFTNSPKVNTKHIIIQRDSQRFWPVLLRQNFDLSSEKIAIRFAGEPGADAGGPLREFYSLSMRRFTTIPGVFFGDDKGICFKLMPDGVLKKVYYKLGQLTGASIIHVGRGPECFSELIFNALYDLPYPDKITPINDAEFKYKLDKIESGENEDLLDLNIVPVPDIEQNKQVFSISYLVMKNRAAISQFGEGLKSICPEFMLQSNCHTMKAFLLPDEKILTLDELLVILCFHNVEEIGSNLHRDISNAICDCELFLADVANGNYDEISLKDILFLFTGMDKIPRKGLDKNIDIFFNCDFNFPKISTCGLNATLPTKKVEHNLKIAAKFGGTGFGVV